MAQVVSGVWGTDNEASAGFLDIQTFPYSDTPSSVADVLAKLLTHFAELKASVAASFAALAPGKPLPAIGMTEYNIVCCENVDTAQLMRRAVNLFFMADSIGAMITNGFQLATAWAMVSVCVCGIVCDRKLNLWTLPSSFSCFRRTVLPRSARTSA
jgi:hypothetical protein